MIADRDTIIAAWEAFQTRSGGLQRPQTEADYLSLLSLLNELTDAQNCDEEPFASLFDLVSHYLHAWEQEHKDIPIASPAEMLAFYMDQHGLNQSDLEREGIAHRTLLSKILSGKRSISKELAKRLAKRFHTNPGVFL